MGPNTYSQGIWKTRVHGDLPGYKVKNHLKTNPSQPFVGGQYF